MSNGSHENQLISGMISKSNRLWNAWLLLQETVHTIQMSKSGFDDDGDVELNVLGCRLTY